MSIQDTATKQYVSEAEVFADAFNYLIYDGEQVIKPEQLTDMDTTQYVIPYHEDEKGKPEATQKYLEQLSGMSEHMERFSQVTNSLTNVSDTLLNSYKNITDNSDGINQNSRGYV